MKTPDIFANNMVRTHLDVFKKPDTKDKKVLWYGLHRITSFVGIPLKSVNYGQ